jgi:hypothetical protein
MPSLSATVVNKFIWNQWERKGLHTDVNFYVSCNVGPSKCPFSCKDSFLTPLKCRFMFMSVFNSTLESVPCRATICNRSDSAEDQITIRQKVLGLVYAELRLSAFSSMATRRNLTDRDITELIPQSDSDAHSSEDEDISAHNDSDACDTIETNIKQCTDNTKCRPTIPVVQRFTRGPSGLQ